MFTKVRRGVIIGESEQEDIYQKYIAARKLLQEQTASLMRFIEFFRSFIELLISSIESADKGEISDADIEVLKDTLYWEFSRMCRVMKCLCCQICQLHDRIEDFAHATKVLK